MILNMAAAVAISLAYGVYQIGEEYARSWIVAG
jgi:hypothetical protein